MRHTEFWARLDAALGPAYSRSWAGTFVITELGRTADEALAAGEDPKVIWRAVCDDFDVSDALRYGLPD